MNQTGIWIDSKKAVIITFKNKESNTKIIYSGVEGKNRVDGEGKEFGRFGDQFSTLEKKLEKKYQLEIIEYLKEVIKELESTDDLVLFGPAQVKIELKKFELLETPLSIESGELTPTLKLKRKNVLAKNKELYNKMYLKD